MHMYGHVWTCVTTCWTDKLIISKLHQRCQHKQGNPLSLSPPVTRELPELIDTTLRSGAVTEWRGGLALIKHHGVRCGVSFLCHTTSAAIGTHRQKNPYSCALQNTDIVISIQSSPPHIHTHSCVNRTNGSVDRAKCLRCQ